MEQLQKPTDTDRYMDLCEELVLGDLSQDERAIIENEMESIRSPLTDIEPVQVQRQTQFMSGYYTEEGIFVRSEYDDKPHMIAGNANDENERSKANKWMEEQSSPEVEFRFGNIEFAHTLEEALRQEMDKRYILGTDAKVETGKGKR